MELYDLEPAFANTERLIRGIRADQWTAATPCAEWDLRGLVNHTTWVVSMFGAVTQGHAPPAPDVDQLGDDAGEAFAAVAARTIDAWRARGFEGTIKIRAGEMPAAAAFGINVFDTFVHGWDVAQSTGQDAQLDDRLCVSLLEFMPSVGSAVRRGDNFGPAFDVPADAPAADRLLGFLGRKP